MEFEIQLEGGELDGERYILSKPTYSFIFGRSSEGAIWVELIVYEYDCRWIVEPDGTEIFIFKFKERKKA